jgi:hypothetical protein
LQRNALKFGPPPTWSFPSQSHRALAERDAAAARRLFPKIGERFASYGLNL